MLKKLFVALLLTASASSYADTIYLCKTYSGGMFWTNVHCNQRNALIERIAEVPSGMTWEQQVAMGEQQQRAVAPAPVTHIRQSDSNQSSQSECAALDKRVTDLDGMARQPQSAAGQDWIRSERKIARDRQFQLRCR